MKKWFTSLKDSGFVIGCIFTALKPFFGALSLILMLCQGDVLCWKMRFSDVLIRPKQRAEKILILNSNHALQALYHEPP